MDMNERERLAESAREFNASARPPHTYVERGVSRKQAERKEPEPKPAAEETKSYSDYRRERDTALYEELRTQRESAEGSGAARRFRNRQRNRRRPLAEGEQPPLTDTLREMATRKSRQEKEFSERYDRSRSGASRIEREKVKGGSAVRDVEYFVPKISGENANDINYGSRKRKTHNKKPMRMWKKASLTAMSLFMVFIMCLGMGVNLLLNRMNFVSDAQKKAQAYQLQQQNAAADAEAAAQAAQVDDSGLELPDAVMFDADIENVLLIGSDRRNKTDLGRSDAMMMVTIDRKHKKIKLTSFLRDLYVKIPGKYGAKLNAAYAVGGAELLKSTIEANLGITIDKYIIVDFTAFRSVVNQIGKLNGHGGIKMTVTAAEANYMCNNKTYGWFPRYQKGAGTYYMNGGEALNYARIRKIDSDFGRTDRQKKVLKQIVEELKGLGYMDLIGIGYSCLEYVTTDFTKGELVGLATEAAEIMSYDMKQISIPINGSYKTQKLNASTEVLAANLKVNAQKLTAFIYDDDMTYESNKKKIVGIYIWSIEGIANSNATTKKTTTTTAASATSSTSSTTAKNKSSGGTTAARRITATTAAR